MTFSSELFVLRKCSHARLILLIGFLTSCANVRTSLPVAASFSPEVLHVLLSLIVLYHELSPGNMFYYQNFFLLLLR